MLVKLGLVEQRHRAVFEVFDGSSVVDVARQCGVSRQSVHAWLRRRANQRAGRAGRGEVIEQAISELRLGGGREGGLCGCG